MFEDKLTDEDETTILFGTENSPLTISDIESMVDKLKTMPTPYLAQQFAHLKRMFDQLESMKKRFSKQIEYMRNTVIPDAFEREGVKSFTTEDGYRVTVAQRVQASIPAETKHLAFDWLKNNGFEHVVQETVNAGTLGALAKNLMESEDPDALVYELPDEFFKVNIVPTTSVTKTK